MSTRYYFSSSEAAPISPAFDAAWEQTGQAVRRGLKLKLLKAALSSLADSSTITIPITTSQDILCAQFVGSPLVPERVLGTVSAIVRAVENLATANATLAIIVKVVSQDGSTDRGTLYSNLNADTEFGTTAATRIINAQAITALTIQAGDRLVVEIGAHVTGPTAAGTFTMRFGSNAASDFALTSGLTTDLNPWIEFSHDFRSQLPENLKRVRVGDGMAASETTRL